VIALINLITMKKFSFVVTYFLLLNQVIYSQNFITEKNEVGSFPNVASSQTSSIYVDENDDWLVHKAASLLQSDIEMVTGKKPEIITTISPGKNVIIIIGSLGNNAQKLSL